jgi:hypothetical protein
MLVVDRVVLQRLKDGEHVVRLANEVAIVFEKIVDTIEQGAQPIDVGEDVRGGDQPCSPLFRHDLPCDLSVEERVHGRNAICHGDFCDVGRLDA